MGIKKLVKKLSLKKMGQKGYTLIEIVTVVAIIVGLMAIGGLAIAKSKESSSLKANTDRFTQIVAGLSEYKMYKGNFPKLDVLSTTWPAGLTSYVDAAYRGGGAYPFGFQCDSAAASKDIKLRTPALDSATLATNVRTKLLDSGVCDASSPAITASNEVDCILTTFKGVAGCI